MTNLSPALTLPPETSSIPPGSLSTGPALVPSSTPSERVLTRAELTNKVFEQYRGTPEYVPMHERLQAAKALRERLCSVPFYAHRAARAAARGDEMVYWLELQASQATAHRR